MPFIRHFLDSSALARGLLPYLPPFILVLVDNVIPPIFSATARVVFREVYTLDHQRGAGTRITLPYL